jgi:hypothetical protein
MAGVFDRDFLSDEQIAKWSSPQIICLPFHEIESVLCLPEWLAGLLASTKCSAAPGPQLDQILESIKEIARDNAIKCAVRRTDEVLDSIRGVSAITRKEMAALKTEADTRAKLLEKHKDLQSYVGRFTPDETFSAELKRIQAAIDGDDWPAILALCEGKKLVRPVIKHLGVGDERKLLKEYMQHCPDPSAFPVLNELRKTILGLFV